MSVLDQFLDGADAAPRPATPLAAALGDAGHRRTVGGNEPLDISAAGRVWLVMSGSIDIFLLDASGRYLIAEIAEGGLVDALAAPDPTVRVIGVPAADTEVVETTREALQALEATAAEPLNDAWRDWLAAFAKWPVAVTADPSSSNPGAALDRHAAAVMAVVMDRRQASLADHAVERLAARRRAEHAFNAGLDNVADLVGIHTEAIDDETADVAGAMARILRVLGHPDIVEQSSLTPNQTFAESVQEIARENELQFRVVGLPERWWRVDLGPMLAQVGPAKAPGALIWTGRHYILHGSGKARVVDANIAAEIDRDAYSFYVPFAGSKLTSWRLLRFGLTGSGPEIRNIGFALFFTGLFSLATPIAMGWLMDPIIPDAERAQVGVIGALLVLLAIGMTATYLVQSLAMLRLEAHADNRVQAAVWIKILNLRAPFFRLFNAGDLANRADGVNAMRKLLGQSLNTFTSACIGLLFSLALMFYYEWRVALWVAIVSALFALLTYLVGRSVVRYNFETLDLTGKLQGIVLQLLGSIAKLRIAGAERQAFLRWLAVYRQSVALSVRQRMLSNRLLVARSAFGPFLTVVVLTVLGAHSGDLFAFFNSDAKKVAATPLMSTAGFVSFNVAMGQFVGTVVSITRAALFLVMLQPYLRRVQPILDAEEENTMQGGRAGTLVGDLELRDVRFRYHANAPLVLRGLSMTVPAGKTVAVVGASGAGKSSIVRLLLGFETPESGEIYIDGTDIRFLNLKDLRQRLGVVLQNGRLLAGSVHDNVSAGMPLSNAEVMEALRIAGLDKDIAALPMGLHTNVADGGITFSGGQRQRLLIARAVIRRPRVLILDEATSALDNVTQKTVVENLRALNCTQFIIAQRLSTIVSADLIFVIDGGQVVETGTYQELMEGETLFKRMAARQL